MSLPRAMSTSPTRSPQQRTDGYFPSHTSSSSLVGAAPASPTRPQKIPPGEVIPGGAPTEAGLPSTRDFPFLDLAPAPPDTHFTFPDEEQHAIAADASFTAKRPPRRYTKQELDMLNDVWARDQSPALETRKRLAERIGGGATARTMYVWFQNRRAEAKRKQKRIEAAVAAADSVPQVLGSTSPPKDADLASASEGLAEVVKPKFSFPRPTDDAAPFCFPSSTPFGSSGSDAANALVALASSGAATPTDSNAATPARGRKRPAGSPLESEKAPSPKIRRYRPEEVEILSEVYRRQKNPDLKTRRSLAERIGNGTTPERVYVWFQNRRAEDRRKQKVAACMAANGDYNGQDEMTPEYSRTDAEARLETENESDNDVARIRVAGDEPGNTGQTKVPRTRRSRLFSADQLAILEEVWEETDDPDLRHRKRLATELGVPPRNVYLWFQRRRMKLYPEEPSPFPRRRGRRPAAAATPAASASGVLSPNFTPSEIAAPDNPGTSFELSMDPELRRRLADGNVDVVQVMLFRRDPPGSQCRLWWATQKVSGLSDPAREDRTDVDEGATDTMGDVKYSGEREGDADESRTTSLVEDAGVSPSGGIAEEIAGEPAVEDAEEAPVDSVNVEGCESDLLGVLGDLGDGLYDNRNDAGSTGSRQSSPPPVSAGSPGQATE